ncbi:MAG: transposase [Bdellovibrionales bacterium]|nr:transposase [Bdellovibrionales bacterium]
MANQRKYFPHGSTLLITTRARQGLPMPPSHVINFLLWGILAAARRQFSVRICHFLFMSNHFHMLLVVDDPADVPQFMRYVKSESTTAINRLLGRKRGAIWDEGYDSPLILSPSRVLHYIKYIYLNPTRANLVDSINEYPGVSSWNMFVSNTFKARHARLPLPMIKRLDSPSVSISEQMRIVAHWESLELEEHELLLEPWAWAESIPDFDLEHAKRQLLSDITKIEAAYRRKRKQLRRSVVGATSLRRQSMLKEHTPDHNGRRSVALCCDRELKERFLKHYRLLCRRATAVYLKWKSGDLSARIPPGLFSPNVPVLASALPL